MTSPSFTLDRSELVDFEAGLLTDFSGIPAYMHAPLREYLLAGKRPGGFVTAVLENDLMTAIGRADPDNLKSLQKYVRLLHNYLPVRSYGSKEAVEAWTARS